MTNSNKDVLVWCVHTNTDMSFTKRASGLLYISAWAFCVARSRGVGNAKALKYGTGKGKIPTPSLYIGFLFPTINHQRESGIMRN